MVQYEFSEGPGAIIRKPARMRKTRQTLSHPPKRPTNGQQQTHANLHWATHAMVSTPRVSNIAPAVGGWPAGYGRP